MTALYSKLNEFIAELNDDDKTDLNNLRSEIAVRKRINNSNGRSTTIYEQRLFPQKQNKNDMDFAFLLSDCKVIDKHYDRPDNYGYRRISKAFQHFNILIKNEIEIKKENGDDAVAVLFNIVNKVENAVLVGIEVDSNKDAYMLFESLNDRGVPLSAIDLIKNSLIAKALTDEEAEASYSKWKQILNYIGEEDYSVQERFFRQYYNAFRYELNEQFPSEVKRKYYYGALATKTTMLDIYDKLIKDNADGLLSDLLIKAREYSIIINKSSAEKRCYTNTLIDLERISGAPSYILLLYLFSQRENLMLEDVDIDEIVKKLIVFFVRRNVTDIPGTRKLNSLFMDMVGDIRELVGISVIKTIVERLRAESADDLYFEEKLRGSIYSDNPDATRFILCDIEARNQTKEIYTDLWSRDAKGKYIWTIEHVFPEGDNIPEEWIQMIASGDADLAKDYLQKYTHKLGNLTITGYNSNLSNKSFEEKKNRTSKENKKIGYRNGLFLNDDIVNEEEWTIDKIKSRTDKLVDIALDLYKL